MADAPEIEEGQPASLALLIAKLFRGFLGEGVGNLPASPIEARWRKLLGVPKDVSFYRAIGEVEQACDKLENQLMRLPQHLAKNREHAVSALRSLRQSFSPNLLHRGWEQVHGYMPQHHIQTLEMAGEWLLAVSPESFPPEGVVPKLLSRVEALIEELAAAPFPAYIKDTLLSHAQFLKWAITNWHLLGSGAVATATGALGVAFKANETQDARPEEERRELRARFTAVLDGVGRVLTVKEIGDGAARLGGELIKLFPPQ